MNDFVFHDAHLERDDYSVDKSDSEQADFDIDSDASAADLKQELNILGPDKAQHALTYVTVAS